MAKNLRIISDEDLYKLNKLYTINLKDDLIIVTANSKNRRACHEINKKFLLSTSFRRVIISTEAIRRWIEEYEQDNKYSLIEVQAGLNYLTITYQNLSEENLDKVLEATHLRLLYLDEKNKKNI